MAISQGLKLRICVFINLLSLIAIIIPIVILRDDSSSYFKWGPSDILNVISIKINNWFKWSCVVFAICVLKVVDTIINELASPILGFNVYNPDKKLITEFSKWELQILANLQWTINSIRGVFMQVVNVSQIDLAFFGVAASEITSIFTIRHLLNGKTFEKDETACVLLINE